MKDRLADRHGGGPPRHSDLSILMDLSHFDGEKWSLSLNSLRQ
jgi:hypothetical protein